MLTDAKIRNLKPSEKRQRVVDNEGLYIEVAVSGRKVWLFRYKQNGKQNWISLGEYPLISLREARELRDKAKRRIFDGLQPREEAEATHSFKAVTMEWLTKNTSRWTDETRMNMVRRLERHILPVIGHSDISELKTKDMLAVFRRMETAGITEMTHRMAQICSQIFRYAVACEYCEYDPTQAMRGALAPIKTSHFASITDPREVGLLLRRIDAYPQGVVRRAMQFSALTFCRPGEIRHAEWSEIRGDEWRIPAEKMKMKRVHIVPLARQAIELLDAMRVITGGGQYVFPSNRAPKGDRPMSENTVLVALRTLGYTNEEMTAHGFRSMASTLLNENGFNGDWIERQLAHVEGNSVRAAYNYAEHLPERRRMMQWWADYLDELRRQHI